MIQFSVFGTPDCYNGFICSGHAGWDEEGYDIVCAAVSVLTTNTINSIEVFTDDSFQVEQAEDGGYLKLMLTENPSSESQLLLNSLVLGMQSILEVYGGEYLSIDLP